MFTIVKEGIYRFFWLSVEPKKLPNHQYFIEQTLNVMIIAHVI